MVPSGIFVVQVSPLQSSSATLPRNASAPRDSSWNTATIPAFSPRGCVRAGLIIVSTPSSIDIEPTPYVVSGVYYGFLY